MGVPGSTGYGGAATFDPTKTLYNTKTPPGAPPPAAAAPTYDDWLAQQGAAAGPGQASDPAAQASLYSPAAQADPWSGSAANQYQDQSAASAAGHDPNNIGPLARDSPSRDAAHTAAVDAASAGPLSGPGPLEQWSAKNSTAFDSPTAAESLYSSHGSDLINTPSASETLFSQGMGQMDPYYDYAQKKSERSINDAAAARGNWNSSNSTNNIRDSAANLYGQQAMQMGARASAADSAKTNRYAATEGMAGNSDAGYSGRVAGAENLYGDWQNAQENRLGGAQTSATGLAQGQANIVSNAYKNAGDLSNQDNLEAFNAQLQKLGIDPKSSAVSDFIKTLGAAGSIATAVAK